MRVLRLFSMFSSAVCFSCLFVYGWGPVIFGLASTLLGITWGMSSMSLWYEKQAKEIIDE